MSIPFLFCALITAVSAVISLGFSIAAAFNTANEVRNMALYICARSVALVLVSAVPFFTGSTPWLQAIACSMIIVQVCDTAVGVVIKDRMKAFGPAGTALLNLASSDLVAELALLIERPVSIADYSIAGVEARSSLVL